MDENKTGTEEIYLVPEETEEATASSTVSEQDTKENKTAKKAVRIHEIPELREVNRKVFKLSDGSEQAVYYPGAVHTFNDETHEFEDIDDSIVDEGDGKHFKCGKNNFTARFSKDETTDELFSIEKGIHSITAYAKRNKKSGKCHIPSLRKSKGKDSLCFEGMAETTDFEYSVSGKGIKENIVVKERCGIYRYQFILECRNLVAEYVETEKMIKFTSEDTDEVVFKIPAPFMVDAEGEVSNEVTYELRHIADGRFNFTVTADSEWINAEERVFPVIIDPQVDVEVSSNIYTTSWSEGTTSTSAIHKVGEICSSGTFTNRMYIDAWFSPIMRNPRVKKAELTVTQASSNLVNDNTKLGLFTASSYSANDPGSLIDYVCAKSSSDSEEAVTYTFDATNVFDEYTKSGAGRALLYIGAINDSGYTNYVSLFGSADAVSKPTIAVTYESSYAVNSSYRTDSHELGRFGNASIDLQCGNLMFDSADFTWAGNRMPVTIKHLYNSALAEYQYTSTPSINLNVADYNAMSLGKGWKLNLMQSIVSKTFVHEGTSYNGYVYTDENGAEMFLKEGAPCQVEGHNTCDLFEDVDGSDVYYDSDHYELHMGNTVHKFDESGRLIRITDEYGNHMDINYTGGKITSVTDGAGREFGFTYNSASQLTSIVAPDNSRIDYIYSNGMLSGITYPGGCSTTITYVSNRPSSVILTETDGSTVYKVDYEFTGNYVTKVSEPNIENDGSTPVKTIEYSYSAASGRTIVKTVEPAEEDGENDNVITTVYTFDNDGSVISEYSYVDNTDEDEEDEEEIDGNKINLISAGSGVVSNIDNLLVGHNFETETGWISEAHNCDSFIVKYSPLKAKFGIKSLLLDCPEKDGEGFGVYQDTVLLTEGDYTFSVYAMPTAESPNFRGFIRVTDTEGNVLSESERLNVTDSEYIRLIAPFNVTSDMSVRVHILLDGMGSLRVDGAQLEKNSYAGPYNMLENSNFEHSEAGWSGHVAITTEDSFNMNHSLGLEGDTGRSVRAYQDVTVVRSKTSRETFILSGWAKGCSVPEREREEGNESAFQLRAVINYHDKTTEEFVAKFSPCTKDWQMASVEFSKSKYVALDDIRVYCEYNYNVGTAYFDNIQLVRVGLETGLSEEDFLSNDDAYDEEFDEETNDTASDEITQFEEARDSYGNALTETTFTDGEFGTIYRAFGYNTDEASLSGNNSGNDLVSETDARGNTTTYTVDDVTSRNDEIIDRCGNKTAYEYDVKGRTSRVSNIAAKRDENGEVVKDVYNNIQFEDAPMAEVSYSYDAFDNMTEIVRGDGMKYALRYNAFRNLESIGIEGKAKQLVTYTYKNGNGKLKQMTYANGHTMKATYNAIGQMIAEKWYDSNNDDANLIAHYKYAYDAEGNIVRSLDIFGNKEYTYTYDGGRIVRATECDVIVNANEIVTDKTLVNTIAYTYNSDGNLTKKRIIAEDTTERVISFETPEDGNTIVRFTVDDKTVTSHSKNDSFGRKEFDELQLGTGFVSRQFTYHAGDVTGKHVEKAKLKSTATTQLVRQIMLSDGRTLSYEYDAEERITKVIDSVDGTTEYTYDALGQLLTEKVNGTVINTMTYDNYGNIVSKNGKAYTYGDSVWKDKLTAYNGQAIDYDAQGNPTSYLGHTLTWEKGRQLKTFDGNTYTYNANGIRTSKTVGGVKHEYVLDGTKILRETWGDNVLVPLYDNEDSVCGIIYNSVPYYFLKNLQGDVIAIVDKNANTVARYSYDAWGVPTATPNNGIAKINPFRYRSYYFDEEISMYYLQSRYYDANVGRFVNADECSLAIFVGLSNNTNIFAYCANDYVNCHDSSGYIAWKVIIIVTAGIVVGLAKVLVTINSSTYKKATGGGKFLQICTSFILGFIQGSITALVALSNKSIILGVLGGLINSIKVLKYNPKASKYEVLDAFINGFSSVVIVNGLSSLAGSILKTSHRNIADLIISYFVEEFFN